MPRSLLEILLFIFRSPFAFCRIYIVLTSRLIYWSGPSYRTFSLPLHHTPFILALFLYHYTAFELLSLPSLTLILATTYSQHHVYIVQYAGVI
jgi:hypothetical protein